MSLLADLKVLYHMTVSPIRGRTHAERLDSFYRGQSGDYDSFRARLLKGRQELYQSLSADEGATWIDVGGGTGSNLEYLGDRLPRLKKLWLVDLSSSLLAVARKRVEARGWTNVDLCEADATTFTPPAEMAPQGVDFVTFSYSLTMIPDWFAAIEQAHANLKPGGRIGVVDFYVSRKYPAEGRARHAWSTRTFWPTWFSMDNVYPNPDHVPFLYRKFEPVAFHEYRGTMPYMPGFRVPYYTFVGQKK